MIKLDSLPFWFEFNLWHMKQKHDQNPTMVGDLGTQKSFV